MVVPVALGVPITLEELSDVAIRRRSVALAPEALSAMDRSRRAIDRLTDGGDDAPRVYGVNTGFGALSETRIAADKVEQLQRNLVRSHASGVGEPLSTEVVRAMMVLRAQVLAFGHSGVRPLVVEMLRSMLERGCHPVIPSRGSVGASGDLAPLAHLALVLIGEGRAEVEGLTLDGAEALRAVGLAPIVLAAKEGLALINGTQMMTAIGALALLRAESLCRAADVTGAMTLEAQQGSRKPFDARLMVLRPHPGQAAVAEHLRSLLEDSPNMDSHASCPRVQDAYSLRCMPQVHGATRDALAYARSVLEREINSVTDNPSVFVRDDDGHAEIVSGGNFHGQPVALALDLAKIAVAELANVAERRIEQLVNPALSSGLPPFLAPGSGLHSGFMIAQVTAAALVSENKGLCHPASVDSIPSSAGREDHVSMGSIAALQLERIVEHVRLVLGIEALVAAQGLDYRLPLAPGRGVRRAWETLRASIPSLTEDRELAPDIERAAALLDTLVAASSA
ncbi:MAG: histidine ammonia-lyase [Deltaproteobacteria bacterium]|nr:histidine ammonia-lyase [Deltaproteobacteria bacterium]